MLLLIMLLPVQLNLFLILVLSVPSFYSSLVEVKKDLLFYFEPCSGEKNKNYISKKYYSLNSTVLLTD